MDNTDTCPVCEGPAYLLGVLGTRAHLRCQDCGADFSVPAVKLAYLIDPDDQGDDE